jgi:hypothetical protein
MQAHVIERNDEDGNLVIEVQYQAQPLNISPRFAPALRHLVSEAQAKLSATPICDICNAGAHWQSEDGDTLCTRHAASVPTAWRL